jgi:DNA primase
MSKFNEIISKLSSNKPQPQRITQEFIDLVLDEVSFEKILDFYNCKYLHNGDGRIRVYCPFHGDINTPDLWITDNRFYCYACHAKGTKLRFVIDLQNKISSRNISKYEAIDIMAKIGDIKFFEPMDKLSREIERFDQKKVVSKSIETKNNIILLNLKLSALWGKYLKNNENDREYVFSVYERIDDLISKNNVNELNKLYIKSLSEIKRRRQ